MRHVSSTRPAQIRRKAALSIGASLAAITLTAGIAAPSYASVQNQEEPDGYVIVDPSDAVTYSSGATFYPTGPISDDTLVVIPDAEGNLPNGLTVEALNEIYSDAQDLRLDSVDLGPAEDSDAPAAEATSPDVTTAASQSFAYAASSSTTWGRAYSGSSHIGTAASFQLQYRFSTPAGYNQTNAGQGLGYYRGYNGSQFGTWSQWYGIGSATSSYPGGAMVPWGETAAVANLRAKCATSTSCFGSFSTGSF